MITLKDLAERCNVSLSTVSKALKNSPEIGKDTIKMIHHVAEELGYHPNSAARTLKTNRSHNLGVIFEDKTGSGLQHQYFATIFDGLKVEAESRGYDITFISDNLGGKDDYYKHSKYRRCDGVAMVVVDFSRPDIIKLVNSDIAVTTLDYVVEGHPAIMSDNVNGTRQLVEYVLAKGHRKIALIHGENTNVTEKRVKTFYKTCKEHDVVIPDEYIFEGIYHDPASSEKATRELLSLKVPPTCIMYPDDFAALGGIRVIRENRLEIGKDISIVGYDGILLSTLLHPPLTTYRQDGEALGKQMAYQLIQGIEDPETSTPKAIFVEGNLVPGESVRDLNLD